MVLLDEFVKVFLVTNRIGVDISVDGGESQCTPMDVMFMSGAH